MKKLLVVDDHPIVLEGIHSVLARKGFKVLKASTAPQALSLAEHVGNIDIFVIDLSLVEGIDGLALIDELRAHGHDRPVVVYTMHEELWNISALMKADVQGIVLKGDNINELVHAIQIVAEGGVYRSATFDEKRREVMQTNGILSTKDVEVLRRLSDGAGNREIARAMDISEKAVEYHRSNILKKLCSRTMLEATRRAISLGIIYSLTLLLASAGISADDGVSRPEAVDLGVSVLWADRNLEASSPLDGGGCYAFGETSTKDTYNWETYVHCDGSMDTCHDFGLDHISGSAYDAAHVILGDGWRMPTSAEFKELIEHCTARMDTIGETMCTTFTAPDGTSITFPWAGYMSESRILYGNRNGTYYLADFEFYVEDLSTLGIPDCRIISPSYAAFNHAGVYLFDVGSVHLGMNIRPVRDRDSSAIDRPVVAPEDKAEITAIYSLDGRRLGTSAANLAPGIYIILYSDGNIVKTAKR